MTEAAPAAAPAVADPAPAPAPAAPAPAAPITGREPAPAPGDPNAPAEWLAALPEELRGDATLVRYKSVEELAKGHIETKKLASSKVTLPNADDPDSFTRFAAAVRPEDPAAYKIDLPEGAPSDFADFMRPKLHEAGLLPRQAELLVQANNEFIAGQMAQAQERGRDELDALQAEMGANQFERSKAAAVQMLDRLGIPVSFDTDLERFVGGGNTLRLLFSLAERAGELGKVDARDVELATGGLKGERALEEARKMMREDKAGKLANPDTPEYARYQKLVVASKKPG